MAKFSFCFRFYLHLLVNLFSFRLLVSLRYFVNHASFFDALYVNFVVYSLLSRPFLCRVFCVSICVGLSVSVVFLRSPNPKPLLTSSAFVKQPRFLSFSGISFLQSCLGSLSVL